MRLPVASLPAFVQRSVSEMGTAVDLGALVDVVDSTNIQATIPSDLAAAAGLFKAYPAALNIALT